MWGDSLVFEQLVSGVASVREGSADTLYSDERKLLSSPSVLNKIPAFSHLFGIKAVFIYPF